MTRRGDAHLDSAAELRRRAETHRVIKGRRWRVTDPALDEIVRQHLVDELMDARRAVKHAKDLDDSAVAAARQRVHDAKVALGERGPTWWEPMDDDDVDLRVASFIRAIGGRLGDIDDVRSRELLHLPPRY